MTASILSRLTNETAMAYNFIGMTLDELCDDIKNNLQSLLNTRAWQSETFESSQTNLFTYGLPDFSHDYFDQQSVQHSLCIQIAHVIERYEPRLSHVRVNVLEEKRLQRLLALRISALLNSEPVQAAVFESKLDLVRQRMEFF
ncbi:MAG: hypothetical protein A3F17_01540 [Gammaproteobacteria bacterium RIFCSPHIGHO2_12_FULL_41_15]|nr:MAG: hypothetical protein A3F17_01540 [Gammaproteobacteria bacterium RIFCSPHIGHO2_12_FULL_41_15]